MQRQSPQPSMKPRDPQGAAAAVEKLMPGIGPKLRPILDDLSRRGVDVGPVFEALCLAWNHAFPEMMRRGLVANAIPGTAKCNAVLGKFDEAARELLSLTELPVGADERPVLSAAIGDQLRAILALIEQIHVRTEELLATVHKEVRPPHRVRVGNSPKGRPRAWHSQAMQALERARVPVSKRKHLIRLVASHMGLSATYRRTQR
jgi:hypothetical protein